MSAKKYNAKKSSRAFLLVKILFILVIVALTGFLIYSLEAGASSVIFPKIAEKIKAAQEKIELNFFEGLMFLGILVFLVTSLVEVIRGRFFSAVKSLIAAYVITPAFLLVCSGQFKEKFGWDFNEWVTAIAIILTYAVTIALTVAMDGADKDDRSYLADQIKSFLSFLAFTAAVAGAFLIDAGWLSASKVRLAVFAGVISAVCFVIAWLANDGFYAYSLAIPALALAGTFFLPFAPSTNAWIVLAVLVVGMPVCYFAEEIGPPSSGTKYGSYSSADPKPFSISSIDLNNVTYDDKIRAENAELNGEITYTEYLEIAGKYYAQHPSNDYGPDVGDY